MAGIRDWIIDTLRSFFGPPSLENIRPTFANVGLRIDGSICWMQLGGPPPLVPGYRLTLDARGGRLKGSTHFVQLVKVKRTRSPGLNGSTEELSSDGEWVLDKRDPYGGNTFYSTNLARAHEHDRNVMTRRTRA